ncbi:hypothetical protein [Vibrio mediterranei]|nr:hypothetical protein [Vibrio mediterranei]
MARERVFSGQQVIEAANALLVEGKTLMERSCVTRLVLVARLP